MYRARIVAWQWILVIAGMIGLSAVTGGTTHAADTGANATSTDATDIGDRREFFVDDYLIESMTRVKQVMHTPQPKDVAIVCDAPWEGNTSAYYTLFKDGDLFRMYYRGGHSDLKSKKNAHQISLRTHTLAHTALLCHGAAM